MAQRYVDAREAEERAMELEGGESSSSLDVLLWEEDDEEWMYDLTKDGGDIGSLDYIGESDEYEFDDPYGL